jgi:hypothetical protein
MTIQVKATINADEWSDADDIIRNAYIQYKNIPTYTPESTHVSEDGVKIYRHDNNNYNPTYALYCGVASPIIDMDDIHVFLTDLHPHANWVKARDYQAWAYRDFMYDVNKSPIKYYASRYSSHLFFQTSHYINVTTIELDGVPPNIIFKMSRNDNGSVYYERNDSRNTRVRICDNKFARSGYLAYYQRMTDIGIAGAANPIPIPFAAFLHHPSPVAKLPLPPGVESIETNVEEDQCILCFKNKSSVQIIPCQHKMMCTDCYIKMEKPECPVCRGSINSLNII